MVSASDNNVESVCCVFRRAIALELAEEDDVKMKYNHGNRELHE